MSPARIVPALADEGSYLASESTFYRVLRADRQLHHRGLARAPRSTPEPPTHTADAPNTVWAWDITWLPSTVPGHFFRLNVILDLNSRKIVAAEVWDTEDAAHSCTILQRACVSESILPCLPQASPPSRKPGHGPTASSSGTVTNTCAAPCAS